MKCVRVCVTAHDIATSFTHQLCIMWMWSLIIYYSRLFIFPVFFWVYAKKISKIRFRARGQERLRDERDATWQIVKSLIVEIFSTNKLILLWPSSLQNSITCRLYRVYCKQYTNTQHTHTYTNERKVLNDLNKATAISNSKINCNFIQSMGTIESSVKACVYTAVVTWTAISAGRAVEYIGQNLPRDTER